MSDNITRCPKCHTSFRVGDAHLNSAKGAVRCGSCLNVFNARENLIAAKKPISADITSHEQASQKSKESAYLHEDDNYDSSDYESSDFDSHNINVTIEQPAVEEEYFLISDDMEKHEDEGNDEFLSAGEGFSSSDDYDSSLFERASMYADEDEANEDDDESWALNLLEDDDEDVSTPNSATKTETSSKPTHTTEYEEDHPPENTTTVESSTTENPYAEDDQSIEDDEDYLDDQPIYADFDEDIGDDEALSTHSFTASDDYDDEYADEEIDEHSPEEEQDEETQYSNSFQIIAEDETEEEHYRKPLFEVFEEKSEDELNTELANQYLESIEPEPVEFSFKTHSNFWQSKLLWGALSLIAGVGILFQVAWIKFDKWSLQQPYRQYYAIACNVLDCTLPVLIDRKKIKTANLVVRSHPKAANALIVDAILQNTAIFEQTFPVLDLVFTDTQEKIVAARRLNPEDYLGGELAGKTHMPIRQPIHIAIEIEDPGEAAVGYKISIAD